MKRILTILVAGICFAVLSRLFSGCSKPKGNLAFVGKPAASGSSFVFSLTNTGDSTVLCLSCQPQMQSGGGAWTDVWSGPQTNLSFIRLLPQQSSQVTVAAPVGGATWRLAVLWIRLRPLTPLRRVELVAQAIFTPHHRGIPNELYTNFSAEVSR